MVARFDAVWLDAGGVLVLPDPNVLSPLLAYYGGAIEVDRHRRAHYAAMAVKSTQGAGELDWREYDLAYVDSLGVGPDDRSEAAEVLGRTRAALLWRWPIPETVKALTALDAAGVPLGVVSNAAGQIEAMLRRLGVCQVGPGCGTPVRCVIEAPWSASPSRTRRSSTTPSCTSLASSGSASRTSATR
jgi:putative hydrolase of the HAD superfamily